MAGLFQRSSLSTMITRALVVVLLLTSFSCSLVVATSTGTPTSETQKSAIETTTNVTTMQEGSVSNTRTTDDGTTSSDGRTAHSDGGTTNYISTTNNATTNAPSTQTPTISQTTVVTTVTGGLETFYSTATSMTSPTTIKTATSSSSSPPQDSVTSSTTNTMNPANDSTSAVSTSQDDKGSAAVAGLCLAGVIILIIAINAFVFFRSKLGACTSQSGVFHVLQMSAIKKNRSNHTDVDVEARVEEDADVGDKTGSSTSLTKDSTSPVDQAPELNGDVKVTVHDTDIEISSTAAVDDGGGDPKTMVENEDSKDVDPATVDSKESVEIVVPVTEEGNIENQNEEPSSK